MKKASKPKTASRKTRAKDTHEPYATLAKMAEAIGSALSVFSLKASAKKRTQSRPTQSVRRKAKRKSPAG